MKFFKKVYNNKTKKYNKPVLMTKDEINSVCKNDKNINKVREFLKNKNIDIYITFTTNDNTDFKKDNLCYDVDVKINGVIFNSDLISVTDKNIIYMYSL